MSPRAEKEPAQNKNRVKWHDNFWIKLAGVAIVGVGLIKFGAMQLDNQRASLETNLGNKIDPATEDIDTFMDRADGFFDDYRQFRLDICNSNLGRAMEGCEAVIAAAQESEQAQDANAPTTIAPTTSTARP